MENKGGDAGGFSGEKKPVISDQDKVDVDFFYEKVRKLNETSGLSLVFNFRETILDLLQFYKEVMKRGGFYQVTKMGKWSEVASVSNLNSSSCISPAQLRNVYEALILQYELMYSRKMPDPINKWPNKSSLGFPYFETRPSSSTGKRKQPDSSSPFPTNRRGPKPGSKNAIKITIPDSDTDTEESIMAPLKPRTGYHIFLRLETHKSKMTVGDSSNTQNLRDKVANAWRALSEEEKLPYIEASKMDKERYLKEMAVYEQQQQENQNANDPTLNEKEQQENQNANNPTLNEKVQQINHNENQNADNPTLNEKEQQENQNANNPTLNEKEQQENQNAKSPCLNEKEQQENQSSKSPTLFNNALDIINFSTPSETDDVYHVSLEKDSGNIHCPDESVVELAKEAMKNAESDDSIFQTDLDNASQDVPS